MPKREQNNRSTQWIEIGWAARDTGSRGGETWSRWGAADCERPAPLASPRSGPTEGPPSPHSSPARHVNAIQPAPSCNKSNSGDWKEIVAEGRSSPWRAPTIPRRKRRPSRTPCGGCSSRAARAVSGPSAHYEWVQRGAGALVVRSQGVYLTSFRTTRLPRRVDNDIAHSPRKTTNTSRLAGSRLLWNRWRTNFLMVR